MSLFKSWFDISEQKNTDMSTIVIDEKKSSSGRRKTNRKSRQLYKPIKLVTPLAKDGQCFSVLSQGYPGRNISRYDHKPYMVRQVVFASNAFSTSTMADGFPLLNFNVSGLDQASTLAALFDQYRICAVELLITPKVSPSSTLIATEWASVLDYDDSTALSTYAQAMDYQNCVVSTVYQTQYRLVVPHAKSNLAATNNAGSVVSPWIDWADTSITHYGVKMATKQTASAIAFDVTYIFWVENRNVR
jgi:hypothetical protein